MKALKKISYSEDVDILMIQLSNKKVDDSYETDRMIVSVDKSGEPVLLEIFNGKRYLEDLSNNLPKSIQKKLFDQSNVAIPHQIRK